MKLSSLLRYGVAALAVALALLLKLLLEPVIVQETPFLLVFAAIMVSAWYGGVGPGLAATVVAALITDYFFLPPIGFSGLGLEAMPMVVFVLEGALVSLVVTALRSARYRAETSTLEAQRHQEDLRHSEERYRAVIEQAADGICLIDVDDKRVLEANPAFQRMFGYTSEEATSLSIYDFIAHDRANVDRNFQLTLDKGRHTAGERLYRRKDGSLVDVTASGSVISYGERKVTSLVIHDITERKRVERRLQDTLDRLLALYEAGQILGSTLESEEVVSRLLEIMQRVSNLTAAIISVQEEDGRVRIWRSVGLERLWQRARYAPEIVDARRKALETEEHQLFLLRRPGSRTEALAGLCIPLLTRDRSLGVLEAYFGPESLTESDTVELLGSLASQAASALENALLYGELADSERRLQDLVEKLLVAQEEERRRVAYDVHDGLTQTAVAAYQHLQAFAEDHPPNSAQGRGELDEAVGLIQRTVREARRVIADLRPTALDDFGLPKAISVEVERLRNEGYQVSYEETLGDGRLPVAVETALFRVAQEALANVRKHAQTTRVGVTLQGLQQSVRLEVWDRGRGFQPIEVSNGGGPGEKVGLSSMKERIALLSGYFKVDSKPGFGTQVVAEVPLTGMEESTDHEE